MRRRATILLIAAAVLLGACGGESDLPSATGKSTVRAINAIPTSSAINFLIEERSIAAVTYKSTSAASEYDDLDYTFNFEVFFTGDTENTRFASQFVDAIADTEYTFLLTGTVANPTLTTWEAPVREFDASATVFQIRVANTANTLGPVDYYFAAAGIAPVLGAELASLSFGEVSEPVDFEAGPYVLTITVSGDPGTVLYTTSENVFVAQTDLIITPFEGDATDTSPYIVQALSISGAVSSLPDPLYPAVIEFAHASLDLGVSDIYDDEELTSLVLAGHTFLDVSAELPIVAGANTLRYTPTGDTSMISVEGTLSAITGRRYRMISYGVGGTYFTSAFIPDRRSVETSAKVLAFQASSNYDFLSLYFVEPDTTIDGVVPLLAAVGTGAVNPGAPIAAGSYDVFVTELGATDILAGPVRVDVVIGDVLDILINDTVDPVVLDLRIL